MQNENTAFYGLLTAREFRGQFTLVQYLVIYGVIDNDYLLKGEAKSSLLCIKRIDAR